MSNEKNVNQSTTCPLGGDATDDIKRAIHCLSVDVNMTVCEECDIFSKCDHTYKSDVARTAISALEKQIPKEPTITIHKYIDGETKEERTYHLKHCPCCFNNKEISYFNSLVDKGTAYCHRCGQALDWSDDKGSSERKDKQ